MKHKPSLCEQNHNRGYRDATHIITYVLEDGSTLVLGACDECAADSRASKPGSHVKKRIIRRIGPKPAGARAPFIEVSYETAYGSTTRLSTPVRCV